jgi:hypothetical protein
MVACGDDKKKDEKKDAQTTEAPAPGEEKKDDVKSLANQIFEAIQSDDEEAIKALNKKIEGLSEADQKALTDEVAKLMQEAM